MTNIENEQQPVAFLSTEDLRRFGDFFYGQTGIVYGESKRFYIERRIAQRMEANGSASFAAYMALLRSSRLEIEQLINVFTINETYYYREDAHLRCLSKALLPDIVKGRGPGDLVRIWSVPCSTGEEPYSLAIWLLENWALVDAYNIEIVGSDIDTNALNQAVSGVYGERSLARLPREIVQRYFTKISTSEWQIIPDLQESVKFTRANLIDDTSMLSQGSFDVIFCRNVLIYFDDASRHAASVNLFTSLNPGGYICLGHSESMARITDRFEARRFDDALAYQRPYR
jgi:chemotaxis protein methyltransferase CheR